MHCYPIFTKVMSLFSEQNSLEFAAPGGLIAVGTGLDPVLCKSDRLVGQVIGEPGKLPDVYQQIELEVSLMTRLIGRKSEEGVKPGMLFVNFMLCRLQIL